MNGLDELASRVAALHPSRIDLSLDRMRRLLARLGDPQDRLPAVVHVAGTNGKGSVVALLGAMLRADGQLVHAYVSPAIGGSLAYSYQMANHDNRGAPIDESRLAGLLERILHANAGAPLTSFEAETAAAFLAFAETPADVVLLETGMGGRLDATNVVSRPTVTVMTPIGLDHMEYLGTTLAMIATEKAGIMRRGVPCVVGRQPDAALAALTAAASRNPCPLIVRGADFDAFEQHGRLVYQDTRALLDLPLPALKGRHQLDNAGTAIAAARQLGAQAPSETAIAHGLTHARWPGRLELLRQGRLPLLLVAGSELWLDGAHNAAAAEQLARFLAEQEERIRQPLHLIVGMLSSKDPATFLAPFLGLARTVLAVPVGPAPRAYVAGMAPNDIVAAASTAGFGAAQFDSLQHALAFAGRMAEAPIRVAITGSLHLVDHALQLNNAAP